MPKATPKGKGPKLDINKKVGPLPLWGWGAIVVGGFYAWRYMHPSTPADTGAQGTVDTQTAGDSSLAPYAPVAGVGGGGFDSGGGMDGGGVTGSADAGLGAVPADPLAPPTASTPSVTVNIRNIIPKPKKRHHQPPPAHRPTQT